MKLKTEKSKSNEKRTTLKKQNGITLIALVITIVVLLILAGVSINTLFSDNGIIKSASKSGTNFKMQAVKEQIQAIKLNWEAERIVDSSVTIQRLWEDLEKAGIIESKTDSVTLKETTTENGIKVEKYEIETKEDGYLVEIIVKINPNGSITIEMGEMEESTNPLPRISIKGVTATSSSITVKVEIAKIEKGKATYMYKLQDTETWSAEKEITGKEITITGLQDKKIYDIKIVAKNENGERTANRTIRTGDLATGKITAGAVTWNNGKASVTLSTTSGMEIQYQINSESENGWLKYSTAGLTNLNTGSKVYARLTDGINYGEQTIVNIEDGVAPQEATISFNTLNAEINKEITATVTLKDNESGINPRKSKWEFNQTSTAIGTEESKYSNTFVSETEIIKLTATAVGNWYLHVLSVDNAGNKKETVKGTVKAEIAVSDYTWIQNKTQVTGTHKTNGSTITKEVGENYDYACGVSSYTGGWKILGAENGKLLIMSEKNIGKLQLSGIAGYNTGVTQLDNMCKPYGTNARSIKVEDINRVTGYDPNKTGNGKRFRQGQMDEYGNKVTYTLSGSTGSNGQKYNGALSNNKYEHPDGREIGSNGVTSITETSTYYYYYADTLTENSSGTTVGIAKTTNAYKALFSENYWLASSCVFAGTDISNFYMRNVNTSGYNVDYYTLCYSTGDPISPSLGVRAVVSL